MPPLCGLRKQIMCVPWGDCWSAGQGPVPAVRSGLTRGLYAVKSGHLAAICGKLAAMTTSQRPSTPIGGGSNAPHILVIHGPNLNLLGQREPDIYGAETLDSINRRLLSVAQTAGAQISVFQSNSEAELVGRVQQALDEAVDFIIINPAAFTHTSVALRDALAAVRIPFVEVHLSNVHAREPFRRHSYFSDVAVGVICGLGSGGYDAALNFAIQYLGKGIDHGSAKAKEAH